MKHIHLPSGAIAKPIYKPDGSIDEDNPLNITMFIGDNGIIRQVPWSEMTDEICECSEVP